MQSSPLAESIAPPALPARNPEPASQRPVANPGAGRRTAGKLERLAAVGLCAGACWLAGCGSTGKSSSEPEKPKTSEIESFVPVQVKEPDPIGKLLLDLDQQMQRWSSLVLTASTSEEQRLTRAIEAQLQSATLERKSELIAQLETGPPINRVRAAGVLGFTHLAEVQSPLLHALSDSNHDVVHNALISLAVLERDDTPLLEIEKLATQHPEASTRSNAMYAMRCILGRKQPLARTPETEGALRAARAGVVDTEPFVRAQSALILGLFGDEESLRGMADLLKDGAPHVRLAALEGMLLIGQRSKTGKGPAARHLTQALASGDKSMRPSVRRTLVRLAELDYGSDPKDWAEWAAKLP